jgi:hypothetical protein
MAEDNFFSRWSRRKVQAKTGEPLPADPPAPAPVVARAPAAAAVVPTQPAAVAAPAVSEAAPAAAPAEPPPSLDDALRLTPQDDFRRFVASDVSPEVRNAAVKKLFADPHFNVMDGLDIYIDDYSKPSPLSKLEMAKMVGAQFLKLVDDPNAPKPAAKTSPPAVTAPADASAVPAEAAQASDHNAQDAISPAKADTATASPHPDTETPDTAHDHHPDLQLQPDHAAQRPGPGHGAG